MQKKFFTWFIPALVGFHASLAQSSWQDVIYLKDGSVFRGTIREQYPDSLVKVQITGGNIIAVTAKDLLRIDYSVKSDVPVKIKEPKDTSTLVQDHGYFNITETGVIAGSNTGYGYYYQPSPVGFTIQTINGYRFNPHFTLGAGLGIDIIDQPMVQLFGDARWEILKRKATPFLYLDAGHGFSLTPDYGDDYNQTSYKGGFTWGMGVGMRFNFRHEGAFLISAGYKMDKRTEHTSGDWPPYETTNEYTYNRLAMKVGLAF